MLAAYRAGKSTVSAFAAVAGATVEAVDVGVGRPTRDIRFEAAMSAERFAEAAAAGRNAVEALDADLLVLGEMGIGNTTAAAAVAAALGGGEVAAWVGRGTGVDDEGLARKREAVRQAVDRIAGVLDPLEVLREVGGAELVAMAAAIVAARHRRLPVLIDGYVVTAAGLALAASRADALDHCIVGHCSSEAGHRRLLERPRQAAVARPRDAPRRRERRDGRRAARRHGVRGDHTGADVRRVVRLTRRPCVSGFLPRCSSSPGCRFASAASLRSPPRCRGSPVVGALVGVAVGAVAAGMWHLVPPSVAAAVAVLGGVLVTGAFHEDGLADVSDAFAGGWSRTDRLRILDDPLHGSYGVAALCGSIVLRIVATAALAAHGPAVVFGALVAAHALARAGSGRVDGSRAGRQGRGARRRLRPVARRGARRAPGSSRVSRSPRVTVGWWVAPLVAAAAVAAAVVSWIAMRKIGGTSGDVLGAIEQVAECLTLVVASGLAMRHSLWWT
jgi:cobalamin synthase